MCLLQRKKTQKAKFRHDAIAKRKTLSTADRLQWSINASEQMFSLITENSQPDDGYVAVYAAIASELSLEHLVVRLAEANYRVAYPAIFGEGRMEFYSTIGSDALDLQSLSLIADPMATKSAETMGNLQPVSPEEFAVVVVPGVAFTKTGYRLGFGGGYYDRYLTRIPAKTKVYGVCFETQIYDSLPVQPHDRRMDAVVTQAICYHST
jgi:5-formyltetrahydrofolate cyclo-ligase